jgi:hypothetical protein
MLQTQDNERLTRVGQDNHRVSLSNSERFKLLKMGRLRAQPIRQLIEVG